MATKIVHIGKDENRVSITLMGKPREIERVIDVLEREFESIHARPKTKA